MKFTLLLFTIFVATNHTNFLWSQSPDLDSKIYGMLIGSAIGDAVGGPVEFVDPPKRSYWCTTDEALSTEGIKELGKLLQLTDYPKTAEPYAQFEPFAPAGSVTDDTRWKMILFNCLKNYGNLDASNFASSYWNFQNTIPKKYTPICEEWQVEYGFVMNHYLGNIPSYPPDRVWGGIPTMAGQMPYLPIATMHPGNPETAYIAAWNANILDVGYAKDITSGIVAGLSAALGPEADWEDVIEAMKNTDPYDFSNVPWVPRKTTLWIDKAHEVVVESNGVVGKLFSLLEKELNAVTWWEAHVPLVTALSFLEICNYDALAALQICNEFGHDTDSYAQVIGAFAGAMYGEEIWPSEMIKLVNHQMQEQYNQDINSWMETLSKVN